MQGVIDDPQARGVLAAKLSWPETHVCRKKSESARMLVLAEYSHPFKEPTAFVG
jgi:hypothetical protein